MATKHIKQDQTSTVELTGDGKSWVLDKGVTVDVGDARGINIYDADGSTLTIAGKIHSFATTGNHYGIESDSLDQTIHITKTGRMTGDQGISVFRDGAHVINDGKMLLDRDDGDGIDGNIGKDFLIENNGTIRAEYGVHFFGNGKVVNGVDGFITAYAAVELGGNGGATGSTFINRGTVIGDEYAFRTGNAADHLVNRGKMSGTIETGGGGDTIDLRHGQFHGTVEGGSGGDTYWVDQNHIKIEELGGNGYDIVWTSSDFTLESNYAEIEFLGARGKADINLIANDYDNVLSGNSGDNELIGGGGEDTFFSGAGNDWMQGGDNADTFVFKIGDGHDMIDDFQQNGGDQDVINFFFLENFKSIDDVMDAAKDTADGVYIKLGKGDSVLIQDVEKAHLDASDFIFHP